MRIVSAQLSSLETLPPQHFAQFRTYLGTSSGSQSAQFRAIEAASGLRDEHFMRALEEHGEIPELVRRVLARPTLQDLFLKLLAANKVKIDDLYLGPGPDDPVLPGRSAAGVRAAVRTVAIQPRPARGARDRTLDRRHRRHARLALPDADHRPEVLPRALGRPGQAVRVQGAAPRVAGKGPYRLYIVAMPEPIYLDHAATTPGPSRGSRGDAAVLRPAFREPVERPSLGQRRPHRARRGA